MRFWSFGRDSALLREDFEGPTLPEGWSRELAARLAGGPEAILEARDGALRVVVGPEHAAFPSLVREVDVAGRAWVQVRARMKTERVDPAPAVYDNCNVYVRFDDGHVQPLRVLVGTHPWTTLSRTFAVPPGARTMRVGLVLTMPGVAWFDDVVVEEVTPEWREESAGNLVWHTLGRDRIAEEHKAYMGAAAAELSSFFGRAPARVDYWKYPDIPTKIEYTGVGGNGHVLGDAIHTIWPVERHELVHVYARAWGRPTPLLGEGLAVWLSGDWQGKPVREAARAILDRWIAVPDLVEPAAFRAADDRISYAVAGALVGWILETHGVEALRGLYGTRGDAEAFAQRLGINPELADGELRRWLA